MKSLFQFPMNVLSPIREYLLKEQQKLLKRKDALRSEDPFEDQGRLDDNADIGNESREQWGHQQVETLKLEIDKMLITIRKALTKIKIGKYGLCERCGTMIDTDRLAINPTAERCMDCEKKRQSETKKFSKRK